MLDELGFFASRPTACLGDLSETARETYVAIVNSMPCAKEAREKSGQDKYEHAATVLSLQQQGMLRIITNGDSHKIIMAPGVEEAFTDWPWLFQTTRWGKIKAWFGAKFNK